MFTFINNFLIKLGVLCHRKLWSSTRIFTGACGVPCVCECLREVESEMRFPHDIAVFSEVKAKVSHGELHDNNIICHEMACETQVFKSVK